jgi:hypothetical protein
MKGNSECKLYPGEVQGVKMHGSTLLGFKTTRSCQEISTDGSQEPRPHPGVIQRLGSANAGTVSLSDNKSFPTEKDIGKVEYRVNHNLITSNSDLANTQNLFDLF